MVKASTYFKYEGRELPARSTMGALVMFKDMAGFDISQGIKSLDAVTLTMLLYCCIKSACRADGIEFTATFEEFCDRITPEDITAWFTASNVVDEKKTAARAKAKAKA